MRGVQATYRITPSTTTELAQPLGQYDNTIYVKDASKLSIPALESNIWGILTINGERIMYRERNTVTNTISSLLRGTAGTGAASHNDGSPVYDIGRGNLLPAEFQNYIVSDTFIGDDSTVSFTSPNIVITAGEEDAVEVYVGGFLQSEQFTGDGSTVEFILSNTALIANPVVLIGEFVLTPDVNYTLVGNVLTFAVAPEANVNISVCNYFISSNDPVTIDFFEAPAAGSEVTILVRYGVTWYNRGLNTASDGVPLQNTNNEIARFLRGEI
jgi:hypothetical protein